MHNYHYVVVEHYRDGGVFSHFYVTSRDAKRSKKYMEEAHPGRTYEIKAI